MSQPPHRALRVLLGFLSLLFAIGGVFLMFSSRSLILRVFMHPPESEISTLLLAAVKEMGGLVLMLSAILFRASRDPERNVAVVDGLIVGLVILAITPLLSLYTLDIQRIYPGYLVWGRSVGRLVLAALIFILRPRGMRWRPAGEFLKRRQEFYAERSQASRCCALRKYPELTPEELDETLQVHDKFRVVPCQNWSFSLSTATGLKEKVKAVEITQ